MRQSAIALSGPQTDSSSVQGGPWSPRAVPERSRQSLELGPKGLNMQAGVSP